ncbi:cysteine desulfurase [Candidatus Parvarchaeota archaeon]|jgi:cysteine desulfurase/selenocysteine lyase|nr:cysteine desulfurase [Candidatus Parvarchaeota archaeon]
MTGINIENVRKDFPILSKQVNGNNLIYFDNAATSQKPSAVIEGLKYFYENINANPIRSIHSLAEESTKVYNDARKKVADFINAEPEEIVFVRNATEAINLVSFSFPFKKEDRISSTYMEHHSNLLPWLRLKERGIGVDIAQVSEDYELDINYYRRLPKNTRLVALTHASNVTGTINDVKEIARLSHEQGALVLVDAAQSIPHMPFDVKDIDADFVAFSGHKMLAPFGIGVLYIKKDTSKNMQPFLTGGEMIKDVSLSRIIYENVPNLFEAGTQNVEGAYGLGLAVEYLNNLGMENVEKYEAELTNYLYERAKELKNVEIYSGKSKRFNSIFSFNVTGLHSHDTAYLLDKKGIAVRSGFHCAQPLIEDRLKLDGAARASLYFYNTKEEINTFIDELNKIAAKYGRQ